MALLAGWLPRGDAPPILLEHLGLFAPRNASDDVEAFETFKAMLRRPNVWLQFFDARRLAEGGDAAE
jgi:hypothetical protein